MLAIFGMMLISGGFLQLIGEGRSEYRYGDVLEVFEE
jgi:hypothetical protein